MKLSTNIKKTLNYLFRGFIIIATYLFIYREVFYQRDIDQLTGKLIESVQSRGFIISIMGVLALMLVNWGIEAGKWKLIIAKIERVSFLKSFYAVLTGTSVSSFTPNRTGEYFGRVFMLDKANHVEGILITMVGSISQLLITIVIGLFAVLYYVPNYFDVPARIANYIYFGMTVTIPIIVFLLLIFYFKIGIISAVAAKLMPAKWERWRKYFEVFEWYEPRELFTLLMLSLMRYFVFTLQFYLLIRIFGLKIPPGEGFVIISVIYLTVTAIPTIALTELGIRGSISIYAFSLYLAATSSSVPDFEFSIFAASTSIWLINLIIPAILGTFFVFRLKFFRR
jgi:hypothetical protein